MTQAERNREGEREKKSNRDRLTEKKVKKLRQTMKQTDY